MQHTIWTRHIPRLIQRITCLGCALGVVWGCWHTATATTVSQAISALQNNMALQLMQWELGMDTGTFSPATAITVSQSAFLEVARPALAALWSFDEGDDVADVDEAKSPIQETPILQESTPSDNGMQALTLTPSTGSDYLQYGGVYIASTADVALELQDLASPYSATLSPQEPQILILHTHGTEAYTPENPGDVVYSGTMRTLDTQYNVVAVGAAMAEVFEGMGISVIHDTALYDYPSYNDAYDRALVALEAHLQENPSISFVIDVHRDAIEDTEGNQYKLITDDDAAVAQLCLVMGSDGGGLSHPDWIDNLRLAVSLQQGLVEDYPTLMRPMLLRNSRYNQHVTTGSLLLEVGAAGNSPEEAIAAGVLFATEMAEQLLAQSK